VAGTILLLPAGYPASLGGLRYVELNPVRAGMITQPEAHPWSSAAAHCGTAEPDAILEMNSWQQHWNHADWRQYLAAQNAANDHVAIRRSTHTGRPLGTPEFVKALEKATQRKLAPKRGPPRETQRRL